MNKSSFFIVGKHTVIEALKNPKRKVLRVFLTEESKKNIHRENQKKNLLQDIKIHFNSLISSIDAKRGPSRGFGMGVNPVPCGNI